MTVIGRLWVRPVDVESDVDLLHVWLTHPKSVFWDMQDADVEAVRRAYREIDESPWHEAYIGLHDGTPAFLMERYHPAHDPVGDVYEVQEGDVGMHFLVAPTDEPVHGFTLAVIWTVMDVLFTDPATRRVVVEPDVRNDAVHALNAEVGFRVAGEVELPGKRALLSFCTRRDYEEAAR
jgi:RimJ/RimL family protein N-acetyltransferase